jgi:hypothetical protein
MIGRLFVGGTIPVTWLHSALPTDSRRDPSFLGLGARLAVVSALSAGGGWLDGHRADGCARSLVGANARGWHCPWLSGGGCARSFCGWGRTAAHHYSVY